MTTMYRPIGAALALMLLAAPALAASDTDPKTGKPWADEVYSEACNSTDTDGVFDVLKRYNEQDGKFTHAKLTDEQKGIYEKNFNDIPPVTDVHYAEIWIAYSEQHGETLIVSVDKNGCAVDITVSSPEKLEKMLTPKVAPDQKNAVGPSAANDGQGKGGGGADNGGSDNGQDHGDNTRSNG